MTKSFRDYLPESFLIELGEGPSDSSSPVSGATADSHPDPVNSKFGKRELKIGDPVKITGDVQFKDNKGKVDDIIDDGNSIIIDLYDQGKQKFQRSDIDFDDYGGEDKDEDDYLHALDNLKKMAGYQ
jgi:hypothetical protein